jgi:hypothetical protein
LRGTSSTAAAAAAETTAASATRAEGTGEEGLELVLVQPPGLIKGTKKGAAAKGTAYQEG